MLSEFSFTPPLSWDSEDSSAAERAPVCVDEDGDLDVPRRHASTIHVLMIGKGHSIDINRGYSEICIKCLSQSTLWLHPSVELVPRYVSGA